MLWFSWLGVQDVGGVARNVRHSGPDPESSLLRTNAPLGISQVTLVRDMRFPNERTSFKLKAKNRNRLSESLVTTNLLKLEVQYVTRSMES